MKDIADPIMAIWLDLPDRVESLLEHEIENGEISFDLKQQAMKGIAKTADGDYVPFMCAKVEVYGSTPHHTRSTSVWNTFKTPSGWKSNLSVGTRPRFEEDKRSETLLKSVADFMKYGVVHLPTMVIQASLSL